MPYAVYELNDSNDKVVTDSFDRFRGRIQCGQADGSADQWVDLMAIDRNSADAFLIYDHSRRRVGAVVKLRIVDGTVVLDHLVVDHSADFTAVIPTQSNFVDELVEVLTHSISFARKNGCAKVVVSAAHAPKLDLAFTTVGFALRPNGVEDGEWLYRLGEDELLAA